MSMPEPFKASGTSPPTQEDKAVARLVREAEQLTQAGPAAIDLNTVDCWLCGDTPATCVVIDNSRPGTIGNVVSLCRVCENGKDAIDRDGAPGHDWLVWATRMSQFQASKLERGGTPEPHDAFTAYLSRVATHWLSKRPGNQ